MSAPRIAVLLTDLRDTPAHRDALALAEAAAAGGRCVDLVIGSPHWGSLQGALRPVHVPGMGLVGLNRKHPVGMTVTLARYLAERRPKLLVGATSVAGIVAVGAAALSRADTQVVTILPASEPADALRIPGWLRRIAVPRMAAVLCVGRDPTLRPAEYRRLSQDRMTMVDGTIDGLLAHCLPFIGK